MLPFGTISIVKDQATKDVFKDLLQYAMDEKALSMPLADAHVGQGAERNFGDYADALAVYLLAGANINVSSSANPQSGSYLQVYIANEALYVKELLELIESKRDLKKPNTQFDYKKRDGYGNTPLILAILTCNEAAVTALLELNKTNSKVGVDITDNEGRSPLMLAAALGMKNVVKELLSQGANVCTKDRSGRDFFAYAELEKGALIHLVSPLLHPDRAQLSFQSNHSYLYGNDRNFTPMCYYPDGQEKKGKEQEPYLIILSNLSPHKEKLDAVIDYLQRKAGKGDVWSKLHLIFVQKQVDDIRYSAQFKMVNTYLNYHGERGHEFLKNLRVAVLKTLYKPDFLYLDILKDIQQSLQEEINKGRNQLQVHLDVIQRLIKDTPLQKSYIEKCLKGQRKVQAYLQTPEAKAFIQRSQDIQRSPEKQRSLEKELRWSAALGDCDRVEQLLREGVNPNSRDAQDRSALDYAVSRFEVVKDRLRAVYAEKAQPWVEIAALKESEAALEKHPTIIRALLSCSLFEDKAKAKDKAKLRLQSDLETSENPFTHEAANKCLQALEESLECKGP